MDDDGGVLGRLPRSRLGTRSEKRADEAKAANEGAVTRPAGAPARAARSAEQRDAAAARPSEQAARRRQAPRARAAPRGEATRPSRPTQQAGGDPIGGALRTTAKVAEGGVKLATGLTRELLRRLPRP
jgi:hypothetical protein